MRKTAFALVVVAGVLFGVSRWRDDAPATVTKDHLVTNRLWIDHIPRHERDLFQVFIVLTRQPIGIFEVRSAWTGTFEAFRYELHGNELRAVFPQKGDRETIKADAKPCKEGRMDYCLELGGNSRGAKRYYSREDWVIPPNADVETVRALAASALEDLR